MGGPVSELLAAVVSWRTLLLVVLVFGFAPGFCLRLLVKLYPKDDPRRQELVADLYALGHFERLLYVGEQLETVLFEGVPHRIRAIHVKLAPKKDPKSTSKRKNKSVDRALTISASAGALSAFFSLWELTNGSYTFWAVWGFVGTSLLCLSIRRSLRRAARHMVEQLVESSLRRTDEDK